MKVLITGGAEGLGRAIVNELKEKNWEITVLDVKKVDDANIEFVEMDMADLKKIEEFVCRKCEKQFDLVVLNAGISATGKFEEIPSSAHKKIVEVNLIAPMVLASQMVKNNWVKKGGKIVMISSLAYITAYPGGATYAATKSALAVYAKSIRKICKKKNIGVLSVFPGPIDTQHAERYAPEGAKSENRMKPEVLAKRILQCTKGSKYQYFPAFLPWAIGAIGRFCPQLLAKMMKKMVFNKLEKINL